MINLFPITEYIVENGRGTKHIVHLKERGGSHERTICGLRSDSFEVVERDMDSLDEHEERLCKRCLRSYEMDS